MADPYIGEIRTVGFNFAPANWATCAGQTMSVSQNQALFALFGTQYGGNGTSTFQLPNTQGRVIVNVAQGVSGLANYPQGQVGGQESITLTQQQLPTHTHTATFTPSGGGAISASLQAVNVTAPGQLSGQTANPTPGARLGTSFDTNAAANTVIYAPASVTGTAVNLGGLSVTGGVTGGTVTNALAGNGLPTPLLQPYVVLLNIIALQGIYPSRQ